MIGLQNEGRRNPIPQRVGLILRAGSPPMARSARPRSSRPGRGDYLESSRTEIRIIGIPTPKGTKQSPTTRPIIASNLFMDIPPFCLRPVLSVQAEGYLPLDISSSFDATATTAPMMPP